MHCQQCRRELGVTEPVYRVAVGYGVNATRVFGGAVGSICAGCALAPTTIYRDQRWRAPEPCDHCSRPVILNGRRHRPQHLVCGGQCRDAIYSKLAVVRRRRLRPTTKHICTNCGESFAARCDAVYCSPSCRNKRPATEHVCANCSAGFTARSNAIYCSLSCRQKAYHRRRSTAA
jgi:hypothetical protein